MNLNTDSSLPNGRKRDSGLSNSVVKSKHGISCYWENVETSRHCDVPDKIQTLMMLKPERHFETRYYCPFKKLSFFSRLGHDEPGWRLLESDQGTVGKAV